MHSLYAVNKPHPFPFAKFPLCQMHYLFPAHSPFPHTVHIFCNATEGLMWWQYHYRWVKNMLNIFSKIYLTKLSDKYMGRAVLFFKGLNNKEQVIFSHTWSVDNFCNKSSNKRWGCASRTEQAPKAQVDQILKIWCLNTSLRRGQSCDILQRFEQQRTGHYLTYLKCWQLLQQVPKQTLRLYISNRTSFKSWRMH